MQLEISKRLAIFVAISLPLAVVVTTNPGLLMMGFFGPQFFLVVPILLLPLLVTASNKAYAVTKLSLVDTSLQLAFYLAWLGIGLMFMLGNFGNEFAQKSFPAVFWPPAALLAAILLKATVVFGLKLKRLTARKRQPYLKKIATIAAVMAGIIAIPAIPYGIAELNYQNKIGIVTREVENAGKVIEANGGVAYNSLGVNCPVLLESTGWTDANCPSARRTWLVPMKYGTRDLKQAILRAGGYTITGTLGGDKGGLDMNLTTDPIGNTPPPYPAPEGKEWRFLRVSVYWIGSDNRP